MHSICYLRIFHIFYAYLLHVLMIVHHHQAEKLGQFREKPTTIMILSSTRSMRYTIEPIDKNIIIAFVISSYWHSYSA
jgi:hypothetical protein